MDRNLAPDTPAVTSGDLSHALTLARWVMGMKEHADSNAVPIARALLYLYEKLQGDGVIVEGDTLKISVALLRDLYERPDHESAVVRFVRGPVERDGTRVLYVQNADQPWICARREQEAAQ